MSQLSVPGRLSSPLGRRTAWVLFAIVFYLSGESAVIWLFDARQIDSPWRWAGVLAFPLLLLAFFRLQRFFGCARGACANPESAQDTDAPAAGEDHPYSPPPG